MHTLFDVDTQIPAFIHITKVKVHDTNAMDEIPYEPNAYYIFDRGYFDLARLYHMISLDPTLSLEKEVNFSTRLSREMNFLKDLTTSFLIRL